LRSQTEYLFFETPQRRELIDITTRVVKVIGE